MFVVVGNDDTIVTSPDGVTWTKRNSGTSSDLTGRSPDLNGVSYGNNMFVVVEMAVPLRPHLMARIGQE
ncbi:hypothetical protein MBAV_003790 [Candidatus Magnetobacterium bavaricum]|uniref:Uncharacterized protein n=1 Tax=Candidatus Magnetobacterium bavaricum TaxID=29290 RepID=A0A0F3GTK1_9BACT|nr:hypothetical protein MBAV_003790 [Candidatus Magnetobacterium bavaricum]